MAKPDPDPTLLTTASLIREIGNLKDLTSANLEIARARSETRLDNLEKRFDHKYTETAADIAHLRDINQEKFNGIAAISAQAREDSKISLDAAFKSAKDAQDKTEQSFTKQIEALSQRTEAASKATNEKIDRLTSRLDTGEGKTRGAGDLWGYFIGVAGLAVALIAVFIHR